jgi:hypothetical protein
MDGGFPRTFSSLHDYRQKSNREESEPTNLLRNFNRMRSFVGFDFSGLA